MLRDTVENDTVTSCDMEPIHIPGSIQPHGCMIIADGLGSSVIGVAGPIERMLGPWSEGQSLQALIGLDIEARLSDIRSGSITVLGQASGIEGRLNVIAFRSGEYVIVELDRAEEQVVEAIPFLVNLEAAATLFERSNRVADLCADAATTIRRLTGYHRVMVYQFLDDDAGVVVGESVENAASFMNHHFPSSDIPKQARALYLRNKLRVIPDVGYTPQPIRSSTDLRTLDLSDSTLRSVSPIHIQYLKNMGVGASASFSVIKDGVLWGLIACHHDEPREIPLAARMGCQALSTQLAREIKSKEDAELYRERIRLRAQEDVVLSQLGGDQSLSDFFRKSGPELAKLLNADGFSAVQGSDLFTYGHSPEAIDIREIADSIRIAASRQPFTTASLVGHFPKAEAFQDRASGLLAVTMSTEVPTILMWFRAEHVEVLRWAGNPHKGVPVEPGAILTPRASFEAWFENVRAKARPWSHPEVEAASRMVRLMLDHRNNNRVRELNRELSTTLRENENLLTQKDFLLKEVNHRVQNSLQLVSAFLRLQSRSAGSADVTASLDEAQKRLNAVALVHRRLYKDESIEVIDLARYLEDLLADMSASMDQQWSSQMSLDLAPVLVGTDKAVNIGLVLTELVINAQKYAYGGFPGPLAIRLEQHRETLRLIVSDRGKGKQPAGGEGFGSKMLRAIVDRLTGTIEEQDNTPGLRTIVTAPIR